MLKKKEWEKIFSLKEWLLVFLRIDFRECSIVDFRNRKVNLYDISRGVYFASSYASQNGSSMPICSVQNRPKLNKVRSFCVKND